MVYYDGTCDEDYDIMYDSRSQRKLNIKGKLKNGLFGLVDDDVIKCYVTKKLIDHFGVKIPIKSRLLRVIVLNYLYEIDQRAISEFFGVSNINNLDFKIRNEVGGTPKMLSDLCDLPFEKIGNNQNIYSSDDKFCVIKVADATYAVISEPHESEETRERSRKTNFTLYFIGKRAYYEVYKFREYAIQKQEQWSDHSNRILVINGLRVESKSKCLSISDSSLIVKEKILTSVYSYIDNLFSLADKPLNVAVKNRLHPGILLYGEPGTGKSTFIEVIAKKYKATIVYINAAKVSQIDFEDLDDRLRPGYTIFVFEDIDIVCQNRDDATELVDRENLNILLQFLDGGLQLEGINYIQIATTNHIEVLDPALTRCGRFDMKIEMTGLDKEMAERLCNSFEVGYDILENEKFPINPAYLQSKILQNMKNTIIDEAQRKEGD